VAGKETTPASRPSRFDREYRVLFYILLSVGLGLFLYPVLVPHIDEAPTRAKVSRVRADLRVIGSLFGQRPPTSDLASLNLHDIFAARSGTYRFATVGAELVVYSVGPDGQDDRALITYDPTNGEESRGDIFRPLRRLTADAASNGVASQGTDSGSLGH
jgi:hypothetical protein